MKSELECSEVYDSMAVYEADYGRKSRLDYFCCTKYRNEEKSCIFDLKLLILTYMTILHPFKGVLPVVCMLVFSLCFHVQVVAQDTVIQPDQFSVTLNVPTGVSVFDNDQNIPDGSTVILEGNYACFNLHPLTGELIWTDAANEDCCGVREAFYMVFDPEGNYLGGAWLVVEIRCGKPDCGLINLDEKIVGSAGQGFGDGQEPFERCVSVCENSKPTLYVTYNPLFSYNWTLPEGNSVGANPAEIVVDYGSAGSSYILLEIINGSGVSTTYNICVDILAGPQAVFTTTGYACLDAPMTFENLFPYAASYTWDFGDSMIVDEDGQFVQHTYTAPGTYTVTLTATLPVYGSAGEALCCCTAVMQLQVVVDDLPGPQISCISTLCAGDEATYTTDATNCGSYIWTVLDPDGNPIPFTGANTNSITVDWGGGPNGDAITYGSITLEVSGCDDVYCSAPTTVIVDIIPAQAEVNGPIVVCSNTTHVYSVPKWLNTTYTWTVSGGQIVGNSTGHTVSIEWGPGPIGTIHVDYVSSFLAALPGHENNLCIGSADLVVDILPEFQLFNSSPKVCSGDVSYVYATNFPSVNYTWTITPAVPYNDLGGYIEIDWSGASGFYNVTAQSNDPNTYCNSIETTTVQVFEALPALGINGPVDMCLGDLSVYTAVASQPGVSFIWSVQGGVAGNLNGPSIQVTWVGPPPYTVSVKQQLNASPFCISPALTLSINEKQIVGPLSIAGSPSCTNALANFSLNPPQHPDAVITWEVLQPLNGSVVSGQGMANATIQWNNPGGQATVRATVSLCGQTLQHDLNVFVAVPVQPTVVQTGYLCPGGIAQLETTQPFVSYNWSTGSTSSTTVISAPGTYSVTTVDGSGCEATAIYNALQSPLPVAQISTGDPVTICIDSPSPVDFVAQTAPSYEFTWFCNGIQVQGPNAQGTYSHVFQGVPGVYSYYIVVEDIISGCTNTSLPITVYEELCIGGGSCTPQPYTLAPTGTILVPNCNQVLFNANSSNFTVSEWYFGDGNNSYSSTPTHTYLNAACYNVTVIGTVPSTTIGDCVVTDNISVCVPLAANFECVPSACRDVDFIDLSTWLASEPAITSWTWNFGFTTLTNANPTGVTFPNAGIFPVTLTVSNGSCEASITKNVTIGAVGVPSISATASSSCVGDPISFSGFAANAVTYIWNFGEGSVYVGQTPQFSYTQPGSYVVQLTAVDANGCTDAVILPVIINPAIPPFSITGGLIICQGDLTTLSAPAGYDYLWSNGAITQDITVGSGSYSVTITDSNGCSRTVGPVLVQENALPVATISGEAFICDAGCTTLFAGFDPTYTYKWFDSNGNVLPYLGNAATICDYETPLSLYVAVSDLNGCTALSTIFTVQLATSPSVSINVTGSLCEGELNTLEVTPFDPALSYTWSTGASGQMISVYTAGLYSVTATDLTSGCSAAASATINPLPDLCSVPVGCYDACDSTKVCALPGLGTYQWNLNGNPIPGANDPCYIFLEDGVYSLTITTPQGCTDTSADLDITIVPCGDESPCDSIELSYTPVSNDANGENPCCVNVSYNLDDTSIFSIQFTSANADLVFNAGSLNPNFTSQTNTPSEIRLTHATLGNALPQGSLSNFMVLCVNNPTTSPQVVYVNWLDISGEIVCTDSITFNCPVEPPCLYVAEDSIFCEGGETFYTFTVCNPFSQTWSVGYIDLIASAPLGLTIVPSSIDLTGNELAPGDCATFTVQLAGAGIGGQTFCYRMVGHVTNPVEDPTALCCSLDQEYCIDIPQCDPCGDVSIEAVEQVSDDCCYSVSLNNGFAPNFFDEIRVISQSPLTNFTLNNPPNSGWFAAGYNGTSVSFIPGPLLANAVPFGVFTLPEICVQTQVAPYQVFTIQWMQNGIVLCEDSFEVFCEPDCGYIFDEVIECDVQNNQWIFSGMIKNTADYTVSEAVISFSSSSGLSAYNQTIALGNLPPGGVFGPVSFPIGFPAQAGDEICFTVTLHEVNADGLYLSCCNFVHCITLPECDFTAACLCGEPFTAAVAQGFIATANSLTVNFSLAAMGAFSDCDLVRWSFGGTGSTGVVSPFVSVTHTFPGPGNYNICFRVVRTDENGVTCVETYCEVISVGLNAMGEFNIFPNPSNGLFNLVIDNPTQADVEISVYDYLGRPVDAFVLPGASTKSSHTATQLELKSAQGVYFVQVRMGEAVMTKRILIAN
jgi:PKD repeat protein